MSEKKGEMEEISPEKEQSIPNMTETIHLLTLLQIIEGDMFETIQFRKEFVDFINKHPREIWGMTKTYSKINPASTDEHRLHYCLIQALMTLWLLENNIKISNEDMGVALNGLFFFVVELGLLDWFKKLEPKKEKSSNEPSKIRRGLRERIVNLFARVN